MLQETCAVAGATRAAMQGHSIIRAPARDKAAWAICAGRLY